MPRRQTVNETGIVRIDMNDGESAHDAYIAYSCVNCHSMNYINIGKEHLLTPEEAINQRWVCEHCGFVHAKDSDLPESWDNWNEDLLHSDELTAERFWQAFFRTSTENHEAYWKKCNVCGRILPNSAFSKHTGFGLLEKQMECRACKGAINAVLNCKRTPEQLRESSIRRRIADMFVEGQNERIDVDALFERFQGRCFKTGKVLDKTKTGSWHIDHILPSKYLYPLCVSNAALLSSEANSNKRDQWPSAFYTNQELVELARITGANLELLVSDHPIINTNIDVNGGVDRYLTVRNSNVDMRKRIQEIRHVLEQYGLVDLLDERHRDILGYNLPQD